MGRAIIHIEEELLPDLLSPFAGLVLPIGYKLDKGRIRYDPLTLAWLLTVESGQIPETLPGLMPPSLNVTKAYVIRHNHDRDSECPGCPVAIEQAVVHSWHDEAAAEVIYSDVYDEVPLGVHG